MAVTLLTSGSNSDAATSLPVGAATLTAARAIVLWVGASHGGDLTKPTIADSGGHTWNEVDWNASGSVGEGFWIAFPTTTASRTFTVSFGATTITGGAWAVLDATGEFTGSLADLVPTAQVQLQANSASALSLTLPAAVRHASSVIFCGEMHASTNLATLESGWTQDFLDSHSLPSRGFSVRHATGGADLSPNASWTGGPVGTRATAFELITAALVTHGPMITECRDVGSSATAMVFARINAIADVKIKYGTASNLAGATTTGATATAAASDYTVGIPITGLPYATKIYYAVLIDDVEAVPSPYPSFTASPADGTVGSWRVALWMCLKEGESNAAALATMQAIAAFDPHLVIAIGDWGYDNPNSLNQCRTQYKNGMSAWKVTGAPSLQGGYIASEILPRFILWRIPDDHDFGQDDCDKFDGARAGALQASREYFPGTYPSGGSGDGVWRSFTYGNVAFFLVDSRSQRDAKTDPDTSSKSMLGNGSVGIGGTQQKTALKAWLSSTPPSYLKCVVSPVTWNPTAKHFEGDVDGWCGYQTERAEIMAYRADNNIPRLIFPTGDLHSGGNIDDGTNSGRPELNIPHANLSNGHDLATGETWTAHVNGDANPGYGRLTVSATSVLLENVGTAGVLGVRNSLVVPLEAQTASPLLPRARHQQLLRM